MNTFSKIRKLYEYIDWTYYGWNDPNKQLEISSNYFARNRYVHHEKRIHKSCGNYPTWNIVFFFSEMLQHEIKPTYKNSEFEYIIIDIIDDMYNAFIENFDVIKQASVLKRQEKNTNRIEKRDEIR